MQHFKLRSYICEIPQKRATKTAGTMRVSVVTFAPMWRPLHSCIVRIVPHRRRIGSGAAFISYATVERPARLWNTHAKTTVGMCWRPANGAAACLSKMHTMPGLHINTGAAERQLMHAAHAPQVRPASPRWTSWLAEPLRIPHSLFG